MDAASEPQLRVILALVLSSLVAVLIAIAALVRSGRAVRFPGLEVKPLADTRTPGRDHVSNR